MHHLITLAQCGSSENPRDNLQTASVYMNKAKSTGGNLIVFPEYFMTAYTESGQTYVSSAQNLEDSFVSQMQELASRYEIWTLFGINEKSPSPKGQKCYNTLVLLDGRGNIQGSYRKTHLFDAFNWKESETTLAGDSFFEPVDTPFGKLGLATCYDLRFPEVARHAALKGAEIFIYPAAWVQGKGKARQWKTLLTARAIENGMYVIGCSQYVPDKYIGQSLACNPFGEIIAEGGMQEELILVPVSAEESAAARRMIPSLQNRRPDLYHI